MPWNEADIVPEWEEPLPNRCDEVGVIAARKVGAADRALEEHVADLGDLRLAVEEDDMSGRMARTMEDFEPDFADLDLVTLLQPSVRPKTRHAGEAEHLALKSQPLNEEGIVGVGANDGDVVALRDLCSGPDMIDMAVGEQDALRCQRQLADGGIDGFDVTAWVDDGGVTRLCAPEQGAVLLEGRHGEDAEVHGKSRSSRTVR